MMMTIKCRWQGNLYHYDDNGDGYNNGDNDDNDDDITMMMMMMTIKCRWQGNLYHA